MPDPINLKLLCIPQFRFADHWDILLMCVGTLCALAHGTALPALIIIIGDMIDSFVLNNPTCQQGAVILLLKPITFVLYYKECGRICYVKLQYMESDQSESI